VWALESCYCETASAFFFLSSIDKIEHISKLLGSLLDFGVMSVSLKLQRLAERNSFTVKIEAPLPCVSPSQTYAVSITRILIPTVNP